jgi:alpha-beta hydrolase superfamily lysophospholipase
MKGVENMEKLPRFVQKLALLTIIGFLYACGVVQSTPTPTVPPTSTPTPAPAPTLTPTSRIDGEEITFTTEDDLKINGYIYRGGGDLAVILAHQRSKPQPGSSETQRSWQFFAELLASKGYTVLTFDFRGVGKSEGDLNEMENQVVNDTRGAIEFLQAEGYHRIVCVGAEMGGTSCMEAAQSYEFEGLVVISSTLSLGEPTKITDEDIERLTMPKLFICADRDRFERIVGETQYLYDNAPEPKQLKFFSGTAHGTELFYTQHAEEFRQLLLDFFEALD